MKFSRIVYPWENILIIITKVSVINFLIIKKKKKLSS